MTGGKRNFRFSPGAVLNPFLFFASHGTFLCADLPHCRRESAAGRLMCISRSNYTLVVFLFQQCTVHFAMILMCFAPKVCRFICLMYGKQIKLTIQERWKDLRVKQGAVWKYIGGPTNRAHTNRTGMKNRTINKHKNTPYPAFEAEYGVLFRCPILPWRMRISWYLANTVLRTPDICAVGTAALISFFRYRPDRSTHTSISHRRYKPERFRRTATRCLRSLQQWYIRPSPSW